MLFALASGYEALMVAVAPHNFPLKVGLWAIGYVHV